MGGLAGWNHDMVLRRLGLLSHKSLELVCCLDRAILRPPAYLSAASAKQLGQVVSLPNHCMQRLHCDRNTFH